MLDRFFRKGDSWYAHTDRGLWIRGDIEWNDGIVRFSWEMRYEVRGDEVYFIDLNEEVVKKRHVTQFIPGESWVEGASLKIEPIISDVKSVIGLNLVPKVIRSVVSHVVKLIGEGWGDSMQDIADDYQDILELKFLREELAYRIVDPKGTIWEGGNGIIVYVNQKKTDGTILMSYVVGSKECEEEVVEKSKLVHLLACSEPVS